MVHNDVLKCLEAQFVQKNTNFKENTLYDKVTKGKNT